MTVAIDIVIIGLNSSKTLEACVGSVRNLDYPKDKVAIYYVDGGSTDGSQRIAESLGVQLVPYGSESPAPGDQRNAGWKAGTGDAVQFLDSDTLVDPDWLRSAVSALAPGVGAVCGDRKELHPDATMFNWIGDQEWNGPAGDASEFGGDVLVLRTALEQTGGYDPKLIGGEDPELSFRIRKAGYRLVKLDKRMTRHDLNMRTVKQYWRRSFRSGHAYAEVNHRHHEFWSREVRRISLRAGSFFAGCLLSPLAVLSPLALLFPLCGTVILLRPRLTASKWLADRGMSVQHRRCYGWHASLVVIPQFCGIVRFWWGRFTGKPLTNRRLKKHRPV